MTQTRQLKFRAWDIESPMMLSWEEIQKDWEDEGYYSSIFSQDHWHCMQFTGLKDRNGVEVFEGDILQYPNEECLAKVLWDPVSCAFRVEDTKASYALFLQIDPKKGGAVVIGNRFQNPDLLNTEQEGD